MPRAIPRLAHEELDVYQVAIEFLAIAMQIISELPRGYATMASQLKDSSMSTVQNIAEGYGKRSVKDQMRFYDIARGSAHESGSILDCGKTIGIIRDELYADGKIALHRVVSMLVKMCR